MQGIGVQTYNIVEHENLLKSFKILQHAGFTCCDFSLNGYLKNTDIYRDNLNHFFDRNRTELMEFFKPYKEAAEIMGIKINQMHMPYPIYVPKGRDKLNDYLWNQVASKSMEICKFLECQYIVVHGFKLANYLGSEDAEWAETEKFINSLAPLAKQYGITICIENLYDGIAGHLAEGPGCDEIKAVKRIDEINKKYGAEVLGFCFDTGHANLVGLDFEKFITTLGSRLKVLHIHDNDGIRDLHQIPFTFTKTRENNSSTDWNGFIRGLRAIHFDKVLSFETAPVLSAFPEEMKEEVLTFIAKIGKYFAGRIEENENGHTSGLQVPQSLRS